MVVKNYVSPNEYDHYYEIRGDLAMALVKIENNIDLHDALNNAEDILEFYKNNGYDFNTYSFIFKALEHDISHLKLLSAMLDYDDEMLIDSKDFEIMGKYK